MAKDLSIEFTVDTINAVFQLLPRSANALSLATTKLANSHNYLASVLPTHLEDDVALAVTYALFG